MFRPQDTKELVSDFLDDCVDRGVGRVRIVHGKGMGTQREIVHSALRKRDDVEDFGLADGSGGSWGATWVVLKSGRGDAS